MSVTVGIHPDEFEIQLFDKRPGDARPFVSLEAREGDGTVTVYLVSAAQCDELIKAAVEAKRLLLGDDAPKPDLPAAEADPANPYGSETEDLGSFARSVAAKHGRFDAGSAAESGFCLASSPTRNGFAMVRCTLAAGHGGDHVASGTGNPPASWAEGEEIDWEAVERAQVGHLPQHKGGHPDCTAPGCGQPGHHLHAASIAADGAR